MIHQSTAIAIAARSTSPPTTPPAIPPALLCDFVFVTTGIVGDGEILDAEVAAGVVDAGDVVGGTTPWRSTE